MQVKRQRGERLRRFIAHGYRLGNGKKLEPVRHEQKAIALMLELRSAGMALAKIGEELESRGIMARNGTRLSPKVISEFVRILGFSEVKITYHLQGGRLGSQVMYTLVARRG